MPVSWPPVLRCSPEWPPALVIDPETANPVYGAEIYTHQGNGRYFTVVNSVSDVAFRCDADHLPEPVAWGASEHGPWACQHCISTSPGLTIGAHTLNSLVVGNKTVPTPPIAEYVAVRVVRAGVGLSSDLGDYDPALYLANDDVLRLVETGASQEPVTRDALLMYHRASHGIHPSPGQLRWWAKANMATFAWCDATWALRDVRSPDHALAALSRLT